MIEVWLQFTRGEEAPAEPRYYCPRYPTRHYDDSPDGLGPCSWCGTDGTYTAPPKECPSCGAPVFDRDHPGRDADGYTLPGA